jgi:hypothetical protein
MLVPEADKQIAVAQRAKEVMLVSAGGRAH